MYILEFFLTGGAGNSYLFDLKSQGHKFFFFSFSYIISGF